MVTYIFGTTVLLASAIFSYSLLLLVFLLLSSINRANSEQLYLPAATWRLLGWKMLLNVSFTFYFNFTTYKGRLICQFYEAQVMDRGYLFIFKSYPTSFGDGPLSKWNGIWTLWFVRISVLITTTLEYSLVNTKVRLSVYKLRRLDQSSLRRWRRNMMMSHDFSRTYVQTHSGQRVLKSPRRFIESAVALCFNSPKYLLSGVDNFAVIIIALTSFENDYTGWLAHSRSTRGICLKRLVKWSLFY